MSADEDAAISVERAPEVSTLGAHSAPRSLRTNDFPAGTVIDGKYRIDAPLGEGGMGVVVAATHLQLRESVALKFLRLEEGDNQADMRSRFRREAQICAKVRNEHIVRVIDVGTFGDVEYMVMEHLTGSDLRKLQQDAASFSLDRAVDIAVQICEGLAEVHAQHIVHRDLKPSNIFITRRADGSELVKILDFGISKWTAAPDGTADDLTKTGAVLGSPKYMAPEQLFGSSSVDARADIWSIGAILYELIAGQAPYNQPSFARLCAELASGEPPLPPNTHRDDLPDELNAAIMLCLEPDLDARLPDVAVLAGELLSAVKHDAADAKRGRLAGILGTTPPDDANRSGQYIAQSLSTRLSVTPTGTAMAQVAPVMPPPVVLETTRSRRPIIAAAIVGATILGLVAVRSMNRASEPTSPIVAASEPVVSAHAVAEPSIAMPTPTAAPVVTVLASPSVSAFKAYVPLKPILKAAPSASASIAAPPPPPPEKKKPSPLEDFE
jgi:serine/threonine protein kinase